MKDPALGFVEVSSYVAAIEAADAMAKAADVQVKCVHKVDGPIVCVICEGDVAACQAAVNAGAERCSALGALRCTNVIPRPQDGSGQLYEHMRQINLKKAARKKARKDAQNLALKKSAAPDSPPAAAKTGASAAPKNPAAKKKS